ncbi:hypothetical protein MLD38_040771 [Melastoma candidum]|nr:hypothetical protein MLD38_040771 [Melastoma candidum]
MPWGTTPRSNSTPSLTPRFIQSPLVSSLPPKESAPAKPKRKGGTGGLSKLCRVSPELEAIVGQPAMPRTEIVRQLWAT